MIKALLYYFVCSYSGYSGYSSSHLIDCKKWFSHHIGDAKNMDVTDILLDNSRNAFGVERSLRVLVATDNPKILPKLSILIKNA